MSGASQPSIHEPCSFPLGGIMKLEKPASARVWARWTAVITLATAAVAASGCNKPLEDYVSETVKLTRSSEVAANGSTVFTGRLDFETKYTSTEYRQVCDTYVCGETHDTVCHDVPRCGIVNGREVCEGSHRECYDTSSPVYCETNCRMEPYTAVNTIRHRSPVTATISGADASKIETLWLGVATNDRFQNALKDLSRLSDKERPLFESLRSDHVNLLVLEGKGVKLARDQDFLKISEHFSPGEEIRLEVTVEANSGGDSVKSAIGTAKRLPPLVRWDN